MRKSYSTNASASPDRGNGSFAIDAPSLYQRIRDLLSATDFELFAQHVGAFNTSRQSAEETIEAISNIIKDRSLFSQMKTLIYTAMSESMRQSISKEKE